jgi:CheY-like chemotaxis protein
MNALSTTPQTPAATRPASRSLHVLVAEDNRLNQKVLVAGLKRLGHTGVVVPDGEQALACLATTAFDLMLLDMRMPVLDGFETLARLRQHPTAQLRQLPVIVSTASDLPDEPWRARQAGADGFLCKPISVQTLEAEIQRVLLESRCHALS